MQSDTGLNLPQADSACAHSKLSVPRVLFVPVPDEVVQNKEPRDDAAVPSNQVSGIGGTAGAGGVDAKCEREERRAREIAEKRKKEKKEAKKKRNKEKEKVAAPERATIAPPSEPCPPRVAAAVPSLLAQVEAGGTERRDVAAIGPDGGELMDAGVAICRPRLSRRGNKASLTSGERSGDGGIGSALVALLMRAAILGTAKYDAAELERERRTAALGSRDGIPFPLPEFGAEICQCCAALPPHLGARLSWKAIWDDLRGSEHEMVAAYARYGFPVKCALPRFSKREVRNWHPPELSSEEASAQYHRLIAKEVEAGTAHVFDTYEEAAAAANRSCSWETDNLVCCELGLAPKTDDDGVFNGKWRLLHDGRVINEGIPELPHYCQLDRIPDVIMRRNWLRRKYLDKGYRADQIRVVAFKADFTAAFKCQAIHPCSLAWMGFSFADEEGRQRFGYFSHASFGIRQSMYGMSEISTAMRYYLREVLGISFSIYVDDSLSQGVLLLDDEGNWTEQGVDIEDRITYAWHHFSALCGRWGLMLNDAKYIEGDCIVFLGAVFDLRRGEIRLSDVRRDRILKRLRRWRDAPAGATAPIRHLESVAGVLSWISQVAFKPGRRFTTYLFNAIRGAKGRSRRYKGMKHVPGSAEFSISSGVRDAASCWMDFLDVWRGRHILDERLACPPEVTGFYTDASLSGYGAYFEGEYITGTWTPEQSALGIAVLEYVILVAAVARWGKRLSGLTLRAHVDNQSVVEIASRYGTTKSSALQFLTMQLYFAASAAGITSLDVRWVSTKFNRIADACSRLEDADPTRRAAARAELAKILSLQDFAAHRVYLLPNLLQELCAPFLTSSVSAL